MIHQYHNILIYRYFNRLYWYHKKNYYDFQYWDIIYWYIVATLKGPPHWWAKLLAMLSPRYYYSRHKVCSQYPRHLHQPTNTARITTTCIADTKYSHNILGTCTSQRTLLQNIWLSTAQVASLSHSSREWPYTEILSSAFWYLLSAKSSITSCIWSGQAH